MKTIVASRSPHCETDVHAFSVKLLLDHDVPDDLSFLPEEPGHDVTLLSEVLPRDSSDEAVFGSAQEAACILLTCNRVDFLHLAAAQTHHGIVIIIRRRTRGGERVALFRLLDRAGKTGLGNNVNFA
jgi:hypothetical protein